MADLAFIAILVSFFVVAGLVVVVCERVIGADEELFVEPPSDDAERDRLAA